MSNFHGTEIEIWAGFVPVVGTEKKNWDDYEQLLRVFFHVSWATFFFLLNIILKSWIIYILLNFF